MKHSLGSLIFFLLSTLLAAAEPYYFTAKLSKENLVVGESALLEVAFYKERSLNTVAGRYVDEPYAGLVNDAFEIEKETQGAYDVERFIRIIRAEKPGEYRLNIRGEVRFFNEEDIIASNNHRDAMEAPSSKKVVVSAGNIEIRVNEGPDSVIGSWQLKLEHDAPEVLNGEPYHFSLSLEGYGDIRRVDFPELSIADTTIFSEPGGEERTVRDGKLWGKKRIDYAVIAQQDFVVPKLEFGFFDPLMQKMTIQTSESVAVRVKQEAIDALLNAPEAKADTGGNQLWGSFEKGFLFGTAFGMMLVFGWRRLPPFKHAKTHTEIRKATSQKALLQALLPWADRVEFKDIIGMLETQNVTKNQFKYIKKNVLEKLRKNK